MIAKNDQDAVTAAIRRLANYYANCGSASSAVETLAAVQAFSAAADIAEAFGLGRTAAIYDAFRRAYDQHGHRPGDWSDKRMQWLDSMTETISRDLLQQVTRE